MTTDIISSMLPQLVEGTEDKVEGTAKLISYDNIVNFLTTKEMIISYLFFLLATVVYYGWRQIYINKEKHYNEKPRGGCVPASLPQGE